MHLKAIIVDHLTTGALSSVAGKTNRRQHPTVVQSQLAATSGTNSSVWQLQFRGHGKRSIWQGIGDRRRRLCGSRLRRHAGNPLYPYYNIRRGSGDTRMRAVVLPAAVTARGIMIRSFGGDGFLAVKKPSRFWRAGEQSDLSLSSGLQVVHISVPPVHSSLQDVVYLGKQYEGRGVGCVRRGSGGRLQEGKNFAEIIKIMLGNAEL